MGESRHGGAAWPSFYRNLASVASKAKFQKNDPHITQPHHTGPSGAEQALYVASLDKSLTQLFHMNSVLSCYGEL